MSSPLPPHPDDEDYYTRIAFDAGDPATGIEEIRQKVTDGRTGETNEKVSRRIGDRLYTIERVTDRDGHTVTKEVWRNVAESEVAEFKKEWEMHKKTLGLKSMQEIPCEPKKEVFSMPYQPVF